MIEKKDLDENIAELECARNHSPQMCARLANLYVIRDKLYGEKPPIDYNYSLAAAPMAASEPLDAYGDSEFLIAIRGKMPASAWKVIDELMDTLKAVNPRVYDSVMRKMRAL